MSVLIVTSVGDIEVDLHTDECPITSKSFLKLCKIKYYNGCLFHKVERDVLAQTGDPTGTGAGGDSVHKLLPLLHGDQDRVLNDEIRPQLRHSKAGTVAMAGCAGENRNASQFYFTLKDGVDHLDDNHTVFGKVVETEGFDTLAKINESDVDDKGRPFKDIRIKHTWILDDPFDDPPQLAGLVPGDSPIGKPLDEIAEERSESELPLDETADCSEDALANNFVIVSCDPCGGGIPGVKPPDNVLYVSKLNPITQDEDLHTIFSRFGAVTSAEIVRDCETGDSLCYAFIEFEAVEDCERAYFMLEREMVMENCRIHDRRIQVDFAQVVPKLWVQFMQSERNANKNGCLLKSGAPDHLARGCYQGVEEKNKGTNYLVKDQNTHRGRNNHRSYDLAFDNDGTNADLEDRPSSERNKMRKVDDPRSELPPRRCDCNMSRRERTHHAERGSRQGKEDDRGRSGWMHGKRHNYSRSGDRSSARYNDSDYRKQSMSRVTYGDADYRRRSEGGRHESDKFDGQRRHGEEDSPKNYERHKR